MRAFHTNENMKIKMNSIFRNFSSMLKHIYKKIQTQFTNSNSNIRIVHCEVVEIKRNLMHFHQIYNNSFNFLTQGLKALKRSFKSIYKNKNPDYQEFLSYGQNLLIDISANSLYTIQVAIEQINAVKRKIFELKYAQNQSIQLITENNG
jgi:hypothetical protein